MFNQSALKSSLVLISLLVMSSCSINNSKTYSNDKRKPTTTVVTPDVTPAVAPVDVKQNKKDLKNLKLQNKQQLKTEKLKAKQATKLKKVKKTKVKKKKK